jgi:hypothetical protein
LAAGLRAPEANLGVDGVQQLRNGERFLQKNGRMEAALLIVAEFSAAPLDDGVDAGKA